MSPKPSIIRRIGNSWRARGKKPGTIDLLQDGFVFNRRRRATRVLWDDVVQIDAGVRDMLSIDLFFVVFHTEKVKVTIDEFDDGFQPFEVSVFAQWPAIRERWIALQCGSPKEPQYETLWRR